MGRSSRFSSCHPAVNFLYFLGAIGCSVILQHPACLALSFCAASVLLVTEDGLKGLKLLGTLMPLFLVLSLVNPLFNTGGNTLLTTIFGRPYTLEALLYGMAVSGMLVTALLWFSSYNRVMTSDKFTSLFGNLIPALSLILVMILRLIPSYQRKAAQITGARKCIGKGDPGLNGGLTVLSSLTSWALEGSIVMADSMRSRGYGACRRSCFSIYRFTSFDMALLVILALSLCGTILGAVQGCAAAEFTPVLRMAPLSGWLVFYGVFLFIPAALNLWEAIKWQYFQSKI